MVYFFSSCRNPNLRVVLEDNIQSSRLIMFTITTLYYTDSLKIIHENNTVWDTGGNLSIKIFSQ